jgi:2',3'-cyclic-nucleotide 2'-phosphodiesterase (5'-nucleotidase family)
MRTFILCLLFAASARAQQFPTLPQLNTGAPALGAGSGITQFTFYVAGDNRPDKGDDLSDGFSAIIPKMAAAQPVPAFVLWGGDTIKGKKSKDAVKQYPKVIAAFAQLHVPVFNVPGNHELDAKGSGDCNDAPGTSGLRAAYEQFMEPHGYGVFRYGNSAFVGINTEDSLGKVPLPKGCYNGFVSAKQLARLQATLKALRKDPGVANIFLFMHRPVIDDNSHQMGPDPADQKTPYGLQLEAFLSTIKSLDNPKVAVVFASHDHRLYQVPQEAGKPAFVVSGGAGAPLAGCGEGKSGKPGAYYHWLQVEVNGSAVSVTAVPLNGTTLCGPPS